MEFLMECQNTIKHLRMNKDKSIGTVVIVVEGEDDEFRLLKHIFTKVLNYNYISMKKNKVMQHEFVSQNNKNTVIVANTKNSSIKSIIDEKEYKDKLYHLLQSNYHKSLKNTNIYIIWDRDKDSTDDANVQNYYKKAMNTFYSSLDNDYEMNGLLLLSYPCHESYNLSNFKKTFYKEHFSNSKDCKKEFHKSRFMVRNINEKTLLLAVENMHRSLLNYGILEYDPSHLHQINTKIYRKEEECFKDNGYFNALSLISIMFIDLGIIESI